MKPIVHLLCGRIGSGKTTFAKKLERDTGAVRFTHDEWMHRIYGPCPPEEPYRKIFSLVEDQIWEKAEALIGAGTDVILDFGFWSRESRDRARSRVEAAGAVATVYSMSCPRQVALERTLERSINPPPDSLWIDLPAFEKLDALYEPMQDDEDFISVPVTGT